MPVRNIVLPPNIHGNHMFPGRGQTVYTYDYCRSYQRPRWPCTSRLNNSMEKKVSGSSPSAMQLADHYPTRRGYPAALTLGYVSKHHQHLQQAPAQTTNVEGALVKNGEKEEVKIDGKTADELNKSHPSLSALRQSANKSTRSADSAHSGRRSAGSIKGIPKSANGLPRPHTSPVEQRTLGHTCNNCEACQKDSLKQIIDQLSSEELSSYTHLLDPNNLKKKPIINQKVSTPHGSICDTIDEDYVHNGCYFHNVQPYDKGSFTIHPQFISENIIDLRDLKRKHHK